MHVSKTDSILGTQEMQRSESQSTLSCRRLHGLRSAAIVYSCIKLHRPAHLVGSSGLEGLAVIERICVLE